jgi:hypothetical protein
LLSLSTSYIHCWMYGCHPFDKTHWMPSYWVLEKVLILWLTTDIWSQLLFPAFKSTTYSTHVHHTRLESPSLCLLFTSRHSKIQKTRQRQMALALQSSLVGLAFF